MNPARFVFASPSAWKVPRAPTFSVWIGYTRLSALPVSRESKQTTSHPLARSRSDRWEPRKPAPPVTTARGTSGGDALRAPPGPVVDEALRPHLGGLEQVPPVDDDRAGEELSRASKVQQAELLPVGAHDHAVRAFHRVVHAGCYLQPRHLALGIGTRPRIVTHHGCAL